MNEDGLRGPRPDVAVFCVCGFTAKNRGDALLVESVLAAVDATPGMYTRALSSFDPVGDTAAYKRPVLSQPLITYRRRASAMRLLRAFLDRFPVFAPTLAWLAIPLVYGLRLDPVRRMCRIFGLQSVAIFDEATRSDVVVAVPGGYLRAPSERDWLWLSHWVTLLACIAAGRTPHLAPASIGPFHDAYRPHARWLLRRCVVSLRETDSLAYLREAGVDDSTARVFSDMAFTQASRFREHFGTARAGDLVGVSVRQHSFPGHSDRSVAQQTYLRAVAGFVDWAQEDGFRVLLVPQCTGQGGNDDAVAAMVLALCRLKTRVEVVPGSPDIDELARIYARLRLLVGTRMHANLIALMCGTPVVAIAYEQKTRGILRTLGLERFAIDIDAVSSDRIVALCRAALAERPSPDEQLKSAVDTAAACAGEWFNDFKAAF